MPTGTDQHNLDPLDQHDFKRSMHDARRANVKSNLAFIVSLIVGAAVAYNHYDAAVDRQLTRERIDFRGFFTADKKLALVQRGGMPVTLKEVELVPTFSSEKDLVPKEGTGAFVPVRPKEPKEPKEFAESQDARPVYQIDDPLWEVCRVQQPNTCASSRLVGLEARIKIGGVERQVLIEGIAKNSL
jgi:hypothetical protein